MLQHFGKRRRDKSNSSQPCTTSEAATAVNQISQPCPPPPSAPPLVDPFRSFLDFAGKRRRNQAKPSPSVPPLPLASEEETVTPVKPRFEFVGNQGTWDKVRSWFKNGSKSNPVLVIEGPVGTGKTHNVLQLIEEFNMDVHEMHSMQVRSAKVIEDGIREGGGKSVNGKDKIVFVDDVQIGDKDTVNGAINALVQMVTIGQGDKKTVKDAANAMGSVAAVKRLPPIVITCQNYWDGAIRELHKIVPPRSSQFVSLGPVRASDMLRATGQSNNEFARNIADLLPLSEAAANKSRKEQT